jgi:putative SOS response-associated peptidase YedK
MSVLAHQFGIDAGMQLPMRYNVAPSQDVATIREPGKLEFMRWGLIPSWADDPKIGYRMINARSETAATKPAFRSAFKKRHCLVLADGFYEWRKEGKQKMPVYIRRADDKPFAFAGLWERWRDIDTCTILTTEPNDLIRPLHDRMPVILSPNDYGAWLNPETPDPSYMLEPCPSDELTCYGVNPIVNNARNEGAQCLERV